MFQHAPLFLSAQLLPLAAQHRRDLPAAGLHDVHRREGLFELVHCEHEIVLAQKLLAGARERRSHTGDDRPTLGFSEAAKLVVLDELLAEPMTDRELVASLARREKNGPTLPWT